MTTHRALHQRTLRLRGRTRSTFRQQRRRTQLAPPGHQPQDQRRHPLGAGHRAQDDAGIHLRHLARSRSKSSPRLPSTTRFPSTLNRYVMGPHSGGRECGLPNHSTRQRGAAVRAGIVENRSSEMSVGMLPPSSAAEVCGADEGRYNAGAVLPQGASDVQSIRAAQTADPRAKQTHPSGPARRSARINSRPGDGDSTGSALSFERSGGEFSGPVPFGWPSSSR